MASPKGYRSIGFGARRVSVSALVVIAILVNALPALAAPDTTAPAWPRDASIDVVEVTATTATLNWQAATDDTGVSGYRIFDGDDDEVATTSSTSYRLTGLDPDTIYRYRVEAYDAEGNQSEAEDLGFAPRVDYPVGANVHAVKIVDVDDDGRDDLIAAAAGSNAVAVLLGNGDGTFDSASLYDSGPGAAAPKNVVSGDFNGDGDLDLAAANQDTDSVGILLGNGDGSFEDATTHAACDGPHDVATADFDGDDTLDVVVACWGTTYLSLFRGNGSGGFAKPQNVNVSNAACVAKKFCAHAVVGADFDNDDAVDIAVAPYFTWDTRVVLNDGDGTFDPPDIYTTMATPHDITIGDFDGDGDEDLATADEALNEVSILMGGGGGSFSGPDKHDTAYGPTGVTTGDLNGDGHTDLAVAASQGNYPTPGASKAPLSLRPLVNAGNAITVYLGDGDGGFELGGYFGGYTQFPEALFDVAIGDVDGDGLGDLVLANWHNGSVSVLLNASGGGPVATFTTEEQAPVVAPPGADTVGEVVLTTGKWSLRDPAGKTVSFSFGNPGDVPFAGDWDCDGVDTPGLYRQSDGFVYLRNSNTQGIADLSFFFGNPGDVPMAGDFNGNGCDTVSVYRPSQGRIFIVNTLGDGDAGLGAAQVAYYFGNPGDSPFTGDFDNDGIDTVGLYRASTGSMYFRNSHTQGVADFDFFYGNPGDRFVGGDWTGNGTDTPGVFRPSEARFYLKYTNSAGVADQSFGYGTVNSYPVAGRWGS